MHRISQSVIVMALFFCSLILFTWGIYSQEVIGFESRFYLFAQEMWQNGPSWFPTTYGEPYPDYPGLATFLIYLTALAAGSLNKLTAVFPSALAAALTLTMTYLIGSLQNKRFGFCAVFLLLMTITFFKSARSITLDIYPALITTTCFYLIYSADLSHKVKRKWWVYPLLALAFAFRGPIGLIMPAGVVCVYYLIKRRFLEFLAAGVLALLVLLLCCAILAMLAYHAGGVLFMQDVLRMEVIGRMGDSHLPFYYYLQTALSDYAVAFPLALLMLPGILCSHKTEQRYFMFQLIGWLFVILIGMSIPGDKKIRYILPLAPAAALIAAALFAGTSPQKYLIGLRNLVLSVFFLLPGLLWILCLLLSAKTGIKIALPVLVVLIALQLLNILFLLLHGVIKMYRNVLILGVAAAAFILIFICIVEPLSVHVERARSFVRQVEQARQQSEASLVFYKEGRDGLPIKYLINTENAHAVFIDNEKDLLVQPKEAFVVTRETQFNSLPLSIKNEFRVLKIGLMGHVQMIVFVRK